MQLFQYVRHLDKAFSVDSPERNWFALIRHRDVLVHDRCPEEGRALLPYGLPENLSSSNDLVLIEAVWHECVVPSFAPHVQCPVEELKEVQAHVDGSL